MLLILKIVIARSEATWQSILFLREIATDASAVSMTSFRPNTVLILKAVL